MTPLLTVEGLRCERGGVEVLKGVSLSVGEGEVVGLLGPNGAGKSTTFGLLTGLIAPSGGEMRFLGQPLVGPLHKRVSQGLGYLPQGSTLFRGLTVADHLLIPLQVNRRSSELPALLARVGLEGFADRRVDQLSGGERRRVEIGRCLALSPSLLLLDEPFVGLDPLAVSELGTLFRSLVADGVSILITDHAVRETLPLCDRVLLLMEGRVVEEGSPDEVSRSETARRGWLGAEWAKAP